MPEQGEDKGKGKVLTCCNFAQTIEGKEVHSPDCPYMEAVAKVERIEKEWPQVGGNCADYWHITLHEDASCTISKSSAKKFILLKCWSDMEQTTLCLTQGEAETVAIALLKTAGVMMKEDNEGRHNDPG